MHHSCRFRTQKRLNWTQELEAPGFDPGSSRMRSERSAIWATPPGYKIWIRCFMGDAMYSGDLPYLFFTNIDDKHRFRTSFIIFLSFKEKPEQGHHFPQKLFFSLSSSRSTTPPPAAGWAWSPTSPPRPSPPSSSSGRGRRTGGSTPATRGTSSSRVTSRCTSFTVRRFAYIYLYLF